MRRWRHTFSTLIENSKPQFVWKIMCDPRKGTQVREKEKGNATAQRRHWFIWLHYVCVFVCELSSVTYILRHGRVVGDAASSIHCHQRCRNVSRLALCCIEFPDVCCLRGIRIDFACNLHGLMAARTVSGALPGTANRRNWGRERGKRGRGRESRQSRAWVSTCLCKLARHLHN